MFIGCICNVKRIAQLHYEVLTVCHGLNVPKGNFTIDYLPHRGVLDEGEGLEDVGHVGVEDPVIVGVDLGHGLKICFIFLI